MRFEIAKDDASRAKEEGDYEFEIFQLPDRSGEGEEDYAAVRPAEELLFTLTQDVYLLQDQPEQAIDILNRIMLRIFNAEDIREALIESDQFKDVDGDGDGELSNYALNLVRTSSRLKFRWAANPRRDPLGTATLAEISVGFVEKWSGKATGKPQDYLPPSKQTGTRSKPRSSSARGGTRSTSSRKSGSRAS